MASLTIGVWILGFKPHPSRELVIAGFLLITLSSAGAAKVALRAFERTQR